MWKLFNNDVIKLQLKTFIPRMKGVNVAITVTFISLYLLSDLDNTSKLTVWLKKIQVIKLI